MLGDLPTDYTVKVIPGAPLQIEFGERATLVLLGFAAVLAVFLNTRIK